MQLPCRVIKVGGSLLEHAALRQRFQQWLALQSEAVNILVAGGGRSAAALRAAESRFGLSQQATHWLSIRALHVTAGLLAELLCCKEFSDYSDLGRWRASAVANSMVVFNVASFLRHVEPQQSGRTLSVGPQVTSDSIAARVAELFVAEELVLLKACEVAGLSLATCAERGIVDGDFLSASSACHNIRLVQLGEKPL